MRQVGGLVIPATLVVLAAVIVMDRATCTARCQQGRLDSFMMAVNEAKLTVQQGLQMLSEAVDRKRASLATSSSAAAGDAAPPADAGDKNPSTPTGQRGSPIEVAPGTNQPTTIGGRDYTGHSLDRMQGRGVPPAAVEDAIQNGSSRPDKQYPDSRTEHRSPDGRVVVITDTGSGRVITVETR
jgi:outer membrane biosynthesis protein TonB